MYLPGLHLRALRRGQSSVRPGDQGAYGAQTGSSRRTVFSHQYSFHKVDYCVVEKVRVGVELTLCACPGDANAQSQPRRPGAADGVLQPDVLPGPALLPPTQEPGSALSLVGSSGELLSF